MNSDKSEEEHEVLSKQIVDYYKKYSQSKQLTKYLSGTSMSYMPQIVHDEEIIPKPQPIIVIDDINSDTLKEKQTQEPNAFEQVTETKPVSPTSSITSNRKLEWDSGADIGYNNCDKSTKLHKSISLPILLDSESKSLKPTKSKLISEIVTVISYSSSEDNLGGKKFPSSSSSSSYQHEAPVQSSSSSAQTKIKPITSSSSSFTSTIAYLKGKIGTPDAESTPKINSEYPNMYAETPIVPKPKKGIVINKIINLCVTKPIIIECFDQRKKGSDKKVQTSYAEALSKSIQTGDSLEQVTDDSKKMAKTTTENQSVIIINYESESDKKTYNSNSQTDGGMIISQCDSFEYYGDNYKNNIGDGDNCAKSNLGELTDSSKDLPLLAQLISEKQSKSLTKDVDRSIELLQKLLKSKKYDEATKKRYIKKIVSKIVDHKYDDSSTSSELFVPKKTFHQKLQENIQWYPPQISKFTVKTFSDEFLPIEDNLKKSQGDHSPDLESGRPVSSLDKKQNTSSGSYQSWKQDKTLSERMLEEKQQGQGDQLVKFAMKERQHQISWIDDEISHLTKLKGLLEKKIQRTTTVYMLSEHYDKTDENSCSCSDSQKNPSRNYVIQTELSESSSSDLPTGFNLNDKSGTKNYQVRELTAKPEEMNINKKVVGDIEVLSDDKTTNIKIRTKTIDAGNVDLFRPKPPTLIGLGKYDTFPKSKVDESKCVPCGRTKLRNSGDTKQYSVEVPLTNTNNLTGKINEIVNRYKTGPSFDKPRKCSCSCNCSEIFRNMLGADVKNTNLTFPVKDVDGKFSTKSDSQPVRNGHKETSTNTDGPQTKCICCKCKNLTKNKHQIEEKESLEGDPKKYSFKVPLEEPTNFNDKDNQPGAEHTEGSPLDSKSQCKCGCKCMEPRRYNETDAKLAFKTCYCKFKEHKISSDTELPKSDDSEFVSCCCVNKNKEPIRLQDAKLQTEECKCCNKDVQTLVSNDESTATRSQRNRVTSQSSSTSSSSETVTDSTESVRSCVCCKRKNVTSKYLYTLRKKLSDQAYPLCRPCYKQNRRGTYPTNCYNSPAHICNCYTVVQTQTLNEIKETIQELNELDNQYCSCIDVDNRNRSNYCTYCKCKLKNTSKNKNGIAYMLTFENDSISQEKKKRHKKPYLEEIKIKIPVLHKKKHKEKENKRKKAKHCYDSEGTSTSGSRKIPTATLQEYLNTNRPEFVHGAESRRRTVNESRMQREEMSDYNKLQFLQKCQEECEKNTKRLFSAKEMKDITRRNYKKLPEVQRKLNDNKEKQLRQASRLMADTFNRKLRENVLKGKRNLPIDVKVVSM